jgi:hypothetical protein
VIDLSFSLTGSKIARTSGNVVRLLATLELRLTQECQNTFGNVVRLLAIFFLGNLNGLTSKNDQECQNSHSEGVGRVPQVAMRLLGESSGGPPLRMTSPRASVSHSSGKALTEDHEHSRSARATRPMPAATRALKLYDLIPGETTMGRFQQGVAQ